MTTEKDIIEEERKYKRDWINYIYFVLVIIILIGMYSPFINKIKESRLEENHCLKEELFYYRINQGLIFSNKVITTKEKADDFDYKCIKWEEEPSFGRAFLGQRLIHEKGTLGEKEQ